ncbi:MAG: pyridoxamine 5'-phosphate oxidase family protein [Acutalibacteraceae bacterium]
MNDFGEKVENLFSELGESRNMVLSTCLDKTVTSRMMSVIILDRAFYFQTDISFRKYNQIIGNPNVALCFDNTSIEGVCSEIGKPSDNERFIRLYEQHYNWSYQKYSLLNNERLFRVVPKYIQRWIYESSEPYVEAFDFQKEGYTKTHYDV